MQEIFPFIPIPKTRIAVTCIETSSSVTRLEQDITIGHWTAIACYPTDATTVLSLHTEILESSAFAALYQPIYSKPQHIGPVSSRVLSSTFCIWHIRTVAKQYADNLAQN